MAPSEQKDRWLLDTFSKSSLTACRNKAKNRNRNKNKNKAKGGGGGDLDGPNPDFNSSNSNLNLRSLKRPAQLALSAGMLVLAGAVVLIGVTFKWLDDPARAWVPIVGCVVSGGLFTQVIYYAMKLQAAGEMEKRLHQLFFARDHHHLADGAEHGGRSSSSLCSSSSSSSSSSSLVDVYLARVGPLPMGAMGQCVGGGGLCTKLCCWCAPHTGLRERARAYSLPLDWTPLAHQAEIEMEMGAGVGAGGIGGNRNGNTLVGEELLVNLPPISASTLAMGPPLGFDTTESSLDYRDGKQA